MSKMLFKRAVATSAAFVTLGFGGAMSLPSVASAATTHPVAQSVQVSGAHSHWGYRCGRDYRLRPWWCFRGHRYHRYGEDRYRYRDHREGGYRRDERIYRHGADESLARAMR